MDKKLKPMKFLSFFQNLSKEEKEKGVYVVFPKGEKDKITREALDLDLQYFIIVLKGNEKYYNIFIKSSKK